MKAILCGFAALAVLVLCEIESKAGPLGIFGGRGGMDCNVRAREEGPKQAKAENLIERPAQTVMAPSRPAYSAPVQIAKGKTGVRLADLAKLNDAPATVSAANVAAK